MKEGKERVDSYEGVESFDLDGGSELEAKV